MCAHHQYERDFFSFFNDFIVFFIYFAVYLCFLCTDHIIIKCSSSPSFLLLLPVCVYFHVQFFLCSMVHNYIFSFSFCVYVLFVVVCFLNFKLKSVIWSFYHYMCALILFLLVFFILLAYRYWYRYFNSHYFIYCTLVLIYLYHPYILFWVHIIC